uniref:Uncharacterized protein n=1 Tax=Rhizophora mucronata TaxID=61149 RepID=A0A2P2NIS2_RHIMU
MRQLMPSLHSIYIQQIFANRECKTCTCDIHALPMPIVPLRSLISSTKIKIRHHTANNTI